MGWVFLVFVFFFFLVFEFVFEILAAFFIVNLLICWTVGEC